MSEKIDIKTQITNLSQSLGFSDCKIASATKLDQYNKHYAEFIAKGRHGQMQYLENHAPLKTNPELIQPGAKSIIMLSINYFQARRDLKNSWQPQIHIPTHKEGQVARYAFGRDYHKVFKNKLSTKATLGSNASSTSKPLFSKMMRAIPGSCPSSIPRRSYGGVLRYVVK